MIGRIIASKKEEVVAIRAKGVRSGVRTKPVMPFKPNGRINIIAELKQRSPSAGAIEAVTDERIAIYSQYGAAISVLTDGAYFGGSFDLLERVARQSPLPILCKDFIIDESQIDLAYSKGADLVLLIVRVLGKERLKTLYSHASELGLGCLVEIHTEEEIEIISGLNHEIVGVNARDLDSLVIDLDRAARMLDKIEAPVRVAESGVKTRKDIEKFHCANTFLIGETLMKSRDLHATFRELLNAES